MDPRDFYKELRGEQTQDFYDAAEAILALKEKSAHPEPDLNYQPEKTAGVLDHVPEALKNRRVLVAAGLGTLGLGTLNYLGSKPQKDLGGRSRMEAAFDEIVDKNKSRGEDEAGFSRKMKNRLDEFSASTAKTFREHPVKSTLLVAAPIGAATGVAASQGLGAASQLGKAVLERLRSAK